MSCSKPLPPFTYELLRFWNRDQLEQFSIVCRHMKKFIDRYFHSKPYRLFNQLWIHAGSYTLRHNHIPWHPNQDDYSVQQFLAGHKCSDNESKGRSNELPYYSFAEMRPYLGPTVRFKMTVIFVAGGSIYNADHIEEMESITYLWRDSAIFVHTCVKGSDSLIVAKDIEPILNSPTILQCQHLIMKNANFSFKDYNVLYTVKEITMHLGGADIDPSNYWPEFFEQPGVKPIVGLHKIRRENVDKALDRLKEAFSSAVLPNAFKMIFAQDDEPLTEFRETNNTSREKLELKKGLPVEYLKSLPKYWKKYYKKYEHYILERSSI